MGKKKPVVNKGHLTAHDAKTGLPYSVRVGSKQWSEWLAGNETFIFKGGAGHFSARRETRRGLPYWYGYRRREGKLCKAYVGKAEELTTDRLEQVSAQLAGQTSALRLPDKPDSQALLASLEKARPASTGLDESDWSTVPFLLATKVQPPALPQHLIARPRLTEQMNEPLTLIDAPGGFGKSTLLNAWRSQRQSETRKSAWVSLDADDNDPVQFWRLVATALQTASPTADQTIPARPPASAPADLRHMVVSLINAIAGETATAGGPRAIALILDDYHHIQTEAIHHSVSFLLDNLPPALQLIISGRTKAPFALGRLRAKGMVVELSTEDLRFTETEGIAFLQRQMAENLLAWGEMQALVKRTEGWAAGLNLAALALKRQADKHQFIAAFAGEHTYLREYFMEDVLQQQPPARQAFLLKTSILRHLTGDLCDAVTGQVERQPPVALVRVVQFSGRRHNMMPMQNTLQAVLALGLLADQAATVGQQST
jgi:LuxR family maltose regulon positive regulatory protein